jgi:hypothetical protein
MKPQPRGSFGAVQDRHATDPNRPEVKAACKCGLDLFYFYRPPHHLKKGRVNIVALAEKAHREAKATCKPVLLVYAGDKTPGCFKYPRETEVATVIAWPDARVWARIGILESRRTSEQKAFVCSTGLNLPVFDDRCTPARKLQARGVAIAPLGASEPQRTGPRPGFGFGRRSALGFVVRQRVKISGVSAFGTLFSENSPT